MYVEGQIWPKFRSNWSNIGLKGQYHIQRPRGPNKTTFPLSLRPWVWIVHKKSEYGIWKAKSGQKLGLIAPNLAQKGPKRPKPYTTAYRAKRDHFSTQFGNMGWIFMCNMSKWTKFCIQILIYIQFRSILLSLRL